MQEMEFENLKQQEEGTNSRKNQIEILLVVVR